MRRSRHRRRGVYVPIFPIVLILAAAAAAVFVIHGFGGGGGEAERNGRLSFTPAPQAGAPASTHRTTASGIACTRQDLGEEAIYTGDLILVNNQVLYHFPEEQPLASIYDGKTGSYYVRDMEVYLAPTALEALNEMLDAFRAQGGSKTVNVVAGYRTREFQQHLFDQSAQRNGQNHAQRFVAQPGGSEHHTGLAVDFSLYYADGSSGEYDGRGEYAWINGHCQEYGWVVRYDPAKEALTGIGDEPWHFRYVGAPHATAMVEQDYCLEEYVDYLRQFPFDGEHLSVECADGVYEIWYSQGSETYLPDSGAYTVSGNNVDGVIVACKTGQTEADG